jgi:Cu2+-containing amine oxidase
MIFTFRLQFVFLLGLVLISCSRDKAIPDSPALVSADSLISPEKMILIMSDVHLVEAAMMLQRSENEETAIGTDPYYPGIFEKYHISQTRYDQNLAFYRQNPENFAKMYDRVIDILETRQKKFTHQK